MYLNVEPDLNELLSEPLTTESKNTIHIKSLSPFEPYTVVQLEPLSASSQRFKKKCSNNSNGSSNNGNNKQTNLPHDIPSIPSIPTNKRKFGYFESMNGILYPLVDAYQCLREGNVTLGHFH